LFEAEPDLAAVFGLYDAAPAALRVISQYRNLLHHFVHQNGNPQASTFSAGCGAIRRSVFEQIGGFDEKRFPRSSMPEQQSEKKKVVVIRAWPAGLTAAYELTSSISKRRFWSSGTKWAVWPAPKAIMAFTSTWGLRFF
jgi:hypothetical protein